MSERVGIQKGRAEARPFAVPYGELALDVAEVVHGDVGDGRLDSGVVGDLHLAVEHISDESGVILNSELAVFPLRGLERELDIVRGRIGVRDEAEGLDLAGVVGPVAIDNDIGQGVDGGGEQGPS